VRGVYVAPRACMEQQCGAVGCHDRSVMLSKHVGVAKGVKSETRGRGVCSKEN
jgi:hypothetical protein